MKLSEILGKKIISACGKEGYIVSVKAEGLSLFFVCADDNEREFTVDMQRVKISDGNFYFEGRDRGKRAGVTLRLGLACIDVRGNYLGNVEDYTVSCGKLKTAKIGKKNYPAEGLILGDVIIVKALRRLKSDVLKDGTTLFKKGAFVTDGVLSEAAAAGEYVQTTLKSI